MSIHTVVEEVGLNQRYLLDKYGDQGKDLSDIYREGKMTKEDAEMYAFILNKLEV